MVAVDEEESAIMRRSTALSGLTTGGRARLKAKLREEREKGEQREFHKRVHNTDYMVWKKKKGANTNR